ncbi:MAG TPA: hypothetical protein DDY27_07190 [Hyphomonadaceae bacterium]|nr:hypothetical protein [Hyphomonadaceae bacterium]
MVAGEHAPELSANDDADRHRRLHAHISQIFEVDRGHSPRRGQRQIQRSGIVGLLEDRRNFIVYIRNDAQQVPLIEGARLFRDITRRITQPQKRIETGTCSLGNHFT